LFESTGWDKNGRLVSPVNFTSGDEFGDPTKFANDLNSMREWSWAAGFDCFYFIN